MESATAPQEARAGVALTAGRVQAGIWEGVLSAPPPEPPRLVVQHLGEALPGVEVAPVPGEPGTWQVRVPIPTGLLFDGVQTFIVSEAASGAQLARFAIIAGEAADEDLRAEVALLRAELDLLKRAFRRHCAESE